MFGPLLTDLLKAFNLIDHELLIAKLNTYDFRLTALKLVQGYLSNRKPQIKNIPRVVVCCKLYLRLQRIDSRTSIIQYFLIGMFFLIEYIDIASYVDDGTPYVSADNIDWVVRNHNLMKINTDKFICWLVQKILSE